MVNGILILLIIGMVVLFYIQNEVPVTVSFLIWKFETSLVSVTGAALLAGIIMMQLLARMRAKREASDRNRVEFLSRHHRW